MTTKRIALVLILFFSAGLSRACASPNSFELRAYRAIVADFFDTSGGAEPALSPDNKTLAFRANGKVWIRHNIQWPDPYDDNKHDDPSWELTFKPAEVKPEDLRASSLGIVYGSGEARNIDWAPDSQRLAFESNCGLCIAESFDFVAKTAVVRAMAAPKSPTHIESPRWSPDGKRIAFVRVGQSHSATVVVLDLDTGLETELAADAASGPEIWTQPWSPDGRSLVYCSNGPAEKDNLAPHCISIVSVSGGKPRRIVDDGKSESPAWCPTAGRIAYSSCVPFRIASKKGMWETSSDGYKRICVVDADGRNRKTLAAPSPSKADIAVIDEQLEKAWREDFEDQFADQLRPKDLSRLRAGEFSRAEMDKFGLLSTAKKAGGEYAAYVKKNLDTMLGGQSATHDRAWKMLSPEMQQQIELEDRATNSAILESFLRSTSAFSVDDSYPVWSPDGKMVGFDRYRSSPDVHELWTCELANGRTRHLFTDRNISSVSWTKNGKALLVQSCRSIAYSTIDNQTRGNIGYPEIWLLLLK